MKQLIIAAAVVLTATSAAFAQDVYGRPGYGTYDAAPGYYYGVAPTYGYYGGGPAYGYYGSGPTWSGNDTERGGPGPRVGAGSGMGVGSQR
jgi:hypothetical protein